MPLYNYKCPECGYGLSIMKASSQGDIESCPKCNNAMKRDRKGASSQVKEVVDNGIMARRVEIPKK